MAQQPLSAACWARSASRWSGKKGTRYSNQVKSTGWDRKIQLQSCWSEIWRWKIQENTPVCVEIRRPRLSWQSMVKKPFSVGIAVPQGHPFSLSPSHLLWCFDSAAFSRFAGAVSPHVPLSVSLKLMALFQSKEKLWEFLISESKSEQTSSSKVVLRGFLLVSPWHQWIFMFNLKGSSLNLLSSVSERFFHSGMGNRPTLLQDCEMFCWGNGT